METIKDLAAYYADSIEEWVVTEYEEIYTLTAYKGDDCIMIANERKREEKRYKTINAVMNDVKKVQKNARVTFQFT